MDAITSLLPTLNAATSVGSTGYNLYNQYQQQQYQNQLRSYAQDPAKMNAYAAQFTAPLNAGLTAGVNNQTQAQLAQAGLSESPAISQSVEAQAIAPYIQQNQQAGYQDALQALQIGGGAIPPGQQQQNSQAALAKILSQFGGGNKSSMNPAQFAALLQQGTVQPDTIDTSSAYVPDYGADLSGDQTQSS